MTRVELRWPDRLSPEELENGISVYAGELGLEQKSRGELKTLPGSVHIHFVNLRQNGTLELTILEQQRRAYLSWHDNRHAPWVADAAEKIRQTLSL